MARPPKVYLLGAGPGDPELLTLRAARRLREADLVLYDALVHPDALAHVRPDAERVFVGKRAGRESARQDTIHQTMLRAHAAGKIVARLKGGDPFLFGRGSEEAEFLAEHGVPFEVVPGVPSPLGAVAFAGFSLTHRDLASSVAFLTATERPEKPGSSHDFAKLATATQTLVFFMGVRRLTELVGELVLHGRPPTTPVAVVQWATMPRQKTVTGTLADIVARVEEAGIGMPALTIVGEVVGLREKLRWWDTRPLFGKRVVVTRAREQAGELAITLRDLGAEPVELPTIRIVGPEDERVLTDAVLRAGTYDAIAFTSANAVQRFFDAAFAGGRDARVVGGALVLAVGAKTRDALRARGILADVVPSDESAAPAARALLDRLSDPWTRRVLFPSSAIAREELPEVLRGAGVHVDGVVAYRTLPPTDAEAETIRAAFASGIDAVLFTSASTVENLAAILGPDTAAMLGPCIVGCIGRTTAAAAKRCGIRVDLVPSRPSSAELAFALEDHIRERSPG